MGPLLKQSQNTKKSLLEAECNLAGNTKNNIVQKWPVVLQDYAKKSLQIDKKKKQCILEYLKYTCTNVI
jgi:hypothetical protein